MEGHERARKGLCLICFDKGQRVIEPGSKYEALINEFVIDGYWSTEPRLPCGLCHSCRKKLESFSKGVFDANLPEFPDYSSMRFFRFRIDQSKSLDNVCGCMICAQFKTNKYTRRPITKRRPGQLKFPKLPTTSNDTPEKAISVCLHCFGQIFKSEPHLCDKKAAASNICKLVPPMVLQKTTSQVLADLSDKKGLVSLSTGGRKVTYQKASLEKKPTIVSTSTIRNIAQSADLSQNQALKIVKGLRKDVKVEPNVRQHLSTVIKRHAEFFRVDEVETKDGTLPVAFCHDIKSFLETIVANRGVEWRDLIYRISIDEGRDHLKVSGSLIFKDSSMEITGSKSTSVRMMHLLALSPMKESYENIKILLEKLELEKIPGELDYTFSQDLKCFNIMLGLGNHRSKFSCMFCHWETDS